MIRIITPLMFAAVMASWNHDFVWRHSRTFEEFRERRKWIWAGFLFAVLATLLSAEAIRAGHTAPGYVLQGIVWLLFPVKLLINRISTGGIGPFAYEPSLPRLILSWVGRQIRRPFRRG